MESEKPARHRFVRDRGCWDVSGGGHRYGATAGASAVVVSEGGGVGSRLMVFSLFSLLETIGGYRVKQLQSKGK
ncbi:MAG: hypothetical protein IPJ12_14500 [Betaproteobacteria bacterium]|nr:hypothetical protein [Betaproteobacteria bacterium]